MHAPAPVTPIPGAAPAVVGYVNLRGNLYLVLDPTTLLLGVGAAGGSGPLIVFKAQTADALAIQVERVGEIAEVPEDAIDMPSSPNDHDLGGERPTHRLVIGVAKLPQGLITLIASEELLPAALAANVME